MPADPARLVRRARRLARALLRPGPSADAARPRTILGLNEIGSLERDELEEICRTAASPVYLGDHVALCRVLARYKLYLDTRDSTFGAHVLLDGFWEPWLTRFIANRVGAGAVVADIGANFGYYSLLLADLVGSEGRVHSVEPNPAAAASLRRSIALNGFSARTIVSECAVGEADAGSACLWVPGDAPGGATLVRARGTVPPGCTKFEVPLASLDTLLGGAKRVDFLKIDAEGSEERIIAGMAKLFAVHRPAVVLEFNAGWYADPACFLRGLRDIYGSLQHVDYDGEAAPFSPERALAEPVEWLVYLDPS